MRFASSLTWPATVPEVNDYEGWHAIDRMTHGRAVDGVEFDVVEQRARRQLYRFRLPPGDLQGSQFKGTKRHPYYVELFAHEMGHLLHLGFKTKELVGCGDLRLKNALNQLTKSEGDENEVEAAATSTLVIEYLGFPYTLQYLLSSTVTNLRGSFLKPRAQVFQLVKEQRQHPKTVQIARQLSCLLTKIKHAAEEEDPALLRPAP